MTVNSMSIPMEIKNEVYVVRDALLSKYANNINKIILFGSYATGKHQADSDIDIAVAVNELPGIQQRREYLQIADVSEERDIDLLFCTKEQLASNTMVYKWINEQGVVVYEQL